MNKNIEDAWKLIVDTRPDIQISDKELLKISISKAFPRNELRELPKKYVYIWKRAFSKLLILLIFILILASSITVYAVFQIIQMKVNEKNTDISIEEIENEKNKIEEIYTPTYLPRNYNEVGREFYNTENIFLYSNGVQDIFFRQEIPASDTHIDNEDTEQEKIRINGMESIYMEKHGERLLIYPNYGYVFYIDTNSHEVTKNDLVIIAESIEKEGK